MSDKAPPVHWNSPVIAKAAEKAGLPINEFIEMCVLMIISIEDFFPGFFSGDSQTPWERLERLRSTTRTIGFFKQLDPDWQASVRELFPDFKFPNNQEE